MGNRQHSIDTAPKASRIRRALSLAERLLAVILAIPLLRSAFVHLGNPYYFLSTVYSYQLMGIESGKWLAFLLPAFQLVVAVCLLFRWWLAEAYLLACLMFTAFVLAQVHVLRQGLNIDCGCFGAPGTLPVGRMTLVLAGSGALCAFAGWGFTLVLQWKRNSSLPQNQCHV